MNSASSIKHSKDTGITKAYLNHLDNLHVIVEEYSYSALQVDAELIVIYKFYLDVLGFKLEEVKRHYFERSAPKVDTIREYTLGDIVNYKNTEFTGDIVPRIFTTGVNILSAFAKTGKSKFMYFLLHSLIVSKEFLGFPVRRVRKILFYQLEEPLSLIQSRLRSSDFDNDDNLDILKAIKENQIIFIRTLRIYDGLRQLASDVTKHSIDTKVDLIIIDTLRRAMRGSGLNENSAEWAAPLGDLQAFGIVNNVSIILLHHHNKSGVSSGTSATMGEANQIVDVFKNIDEKGKVKNAKFPPNALIFKTTPRASAASTFITGTRKDGSKEYLELLEEEGVSYEILSLEVKVVNFLKQDIHNENVCKGVTFKEISSNLKCEGNDNLVITLERLQQSCFIDSNRIKGIDYYYIPNYILDQYSNLGVLGKAERLSIKHQDISVLLQTATTKEDVNEAFKGLSKVDQDTVWGLLSQENQDRIRQIQDK